MRARRHECDEARCRFICADHAEIVGLRVDHEKHVAAGRELAGLGTLPDRDRFRHLAHRNCYRNDMAGGEIGNEENLSIGGEGRVRGR